MARIIDPLYPICLIVLAVLAVTAVWAAVYKRSQTTRFLTFCKRTLSAVCLILIAVIAIVCLFLSSPRADALGTPGSLTEIDEVGKPIIVGGHTVELRRRPTRGGDFRVNFERNRHVFMHLPTDYDAAKRNFYPVLFLLHGGHESDPAYWSFRQARMNQYADRYKFIVVYVVAQPLYKVLKTPYYAWNSALGTLGKFNDRFEDDAQFIERVHHWVMENTGSDPNNFNLAGFSEGALMAADVAQSGKLAINWLIVAGGTMLEGQQTKHPYRRGPANVLIQLDLNDDKILPLENEFGEVAYGKLYNLATIGLGFWNLAQSRPGLQEKFWVDDAMPAGGFAKIELSADPAGWWQCRTYSTRTKAGKERKVIVYELRGQHAWHGSPEGGDPELGILPNTDFHLGDIIAKLISGQEAPPTDR